MFEGIERSEDIFHIWRWQVSDHIVYVGDFNGWYDEEDNIDHWYITIDLYAYSSSAITRCGSTTYYSGTETTMNEQIVSKSIPNVKERTLLKLKSDPDNIICGVTDKSVLESILYNLLYMTDIELSALIDSFGLDI